MCNFPVNLPFKGFKMCRMTRGSWINEVEKRHHPRGYDYYWMVGEYRNDEPEATDTDQWALESWIYLHYAYQDRCDGL